MVQSSTLAADTIGNTVTATVFGTSYTVPAESLSKAGRKLDVESWGFYSTDAVLGHAVTMDLMMGSTVVCTTGSKSLSLAGASNDEWFAKWAVVCGTTGSSGIVEAHGMVLYEGSALAPDVAFARGQTTTMNLTGALRLAQRITWGTSSASNTITQRLFSVEQGGAL